MTSRPREMRRIIEELLNSGEIDVILTIGGTGLSKRDVTVETVSKTVEKREGSGSFSDPSATVK